MSSLRVCVSPALQDQNYGHKALRHRPCTLTSEPLACKSPPPSYCRLLVLTQHVQRHTDEKKTALVTRPPLTYAHGDVVDEETMVLYFFANFIDRGSVPIKRGGDSVLSRF